MGKDSKSAVQVLMGTPAKGSRSPWGSGLLWNALLPREQRDPDLPHVWRNRPWHGGKGSEGDGQNRGAGVGPLLPSTQACYQLLGAYSCSLVTKDTPRGPQLC